MNKKTIISLLATVTLTSLAAVHAEETSKQGAFYIVIKDCFC